MAATHEQADCRLGHRLRRQAGDRRGRRRTPSSSSSASASATRTRSASTSARSAASTRSASSRTDDVDALSRSSPTRSSITGRPRRTRTRTSASIVRVPARRYRRVSTAMTPWVWPAMKQNPPTGSSPIDGGVRGGRRVVLHHGHRPGLRQRPVPDDADGPVRRDRRWCARSRSSTTSTTTGDYEDRDGHRPAAGLRAAARAHRHPRDGLGRDRADDGGRGSASSSTRSPRRGTSGSPTSTIDSAKGVIEPGHVAASTSRSTASTAARPRIQLEHVNRVQRGSAPDWPQRDGVDVYRVEIEGESIDHAGDCSSARH